MRVVIENRAIRGGPTEKSYLMEGVSRRLFQGEEPASARPLGSRLAGVFKKQAEWQTDRVVSGP